ncbi:nucleoside-diphosphate kinase [Candidatus Uhrbacteria bacterium]|nr:nucleoside-diphosphate kinase [Candidatus Uhrbacteria bacterium]
MESNEERSLLLLKPDAVRRGLIGEIVQRFEQREFTICAMKMIHAGKEQMRAHYAANANNPEWLSRVGQNTIEAFRENGKDPKAELGTDDVLEVGKLGIEWLVSFMTTGPLVAIVVKGPDAVAMVRKIIGSTMPSKADIGSIRGDYSIDSPVIATLEKRTVQNLIHASGSREEAEFEVGHWFTKEELCR